MPRIRNRQVHPCEVSPELRAALKTLAASLPPGTPVPVPAEQLLALLANEPSPSTQAASTDDRLLTVEQVADRLGVSRLWCYRNQRQLGATKVGRSVRFSEHSVQRFLTRRSVNRMGPS